MLQYPAHRQTGIPVIRPLTTTGDTLGTFNANGNYSVTPQDFYYQPPVGLKFNLSQLQVTISDPTSLNMTDYGSIAGGLTNGLKLFIQGNGVEQQILASQQIKQNNDFYVLSFHVVKSTFSGVPQTLAAEFDLPGDYGMPLYLNGDLGDRIIVRLNDDFTALAVHKFTARGTLS